MSLVYDVNDYRQAVWIAQFSEIVKLIYFYEVGTDNTMSQSGGHGYKKDAKQKQPGTPQGVVLAEEPRMNGKTNRFLRRRGYYNFSLHY